MKAFRWRFAPTEVKDALEILNELGNRFDSEAFQTVRDILENSFLKDKNEVVNLVKQGVSSQIQVHNAITNLAGDLVESGNYHVYRGALNTVGQDLLRLFDFSTDELVRLGSIDVSFAKKQKADLRKNMKSVG